MSDVMMSCHFMSCVMPCDVMPCLVSNVVSSDLLYACYAVLCPIVTFSHEAYQTFMASH